MVASMFTLSFSLTPIAGISWKQFYTLIWAPDFYNSCPGDTSRSPGFDG